MTSGDAGTAFAAGRMPAAVTWEPWLSKTEKNPDGHVLVSTEKYPEIITDQVAFAPDFVKQHPDSVKRFIEGYQASVDFLKSNEDEALEDVSEYLGQSPDEIKATMETVPIWGVDGVAGVLRDEGRAQDRSSTSSRSRGSSGRGSARSTASRTPTTRSTPRSSSRPAADRAGST